MNELKLAAKKLDGLLGKVAAQKTKLAKIGLSPGIPEKVISAISEFMGCVRRDPSVSAEFDAQLSREVTNEVPERSHYHLDRLSRAVDDPVGDVGRVQALLADHCGGQFIAQSMKDAVQAIVEVAERQPRNDEPTDADLLIGRQVLNEMATRNPAVEKFRKAIRAKGLKGSNAKFGKVLSLLKSEKKTAK